MCLPGTPDIQKSLPCRVRRSPDCQLRLPCCSRLRLAQEIEVLSAQPDSVSLRVNCRILTAERMVTFLGELHSGVPEAIHDKLMLAFREILLGAMGHAEAFDRHKVVEVSAVRTERTIVFYVRDPETGFHRATLAHAAPTKVAGPIANIEQIGLMGMLGDSPRYSIRA